MGERTNDYAEVTRMGHCIIGETGKTYHEVTVASSCRGAGIAVAEAEAACSKLQGRSKEFYMDCQIDFCVAGGEMVVAEEALEEEEAENPQPRCAKSNDCDPVSTCCNALKDQATLTLDNVVSNELCSGGELRYGSALTQNGQIMDMVVKAKGMDCTGKMSDAKNGAKNKQIGTLGVKAGTSTTFEFTFVEHSTSIAVAPQSLVMTFLDIDQGKKGKQRESVEVCNGANAIMTDDTELEFSSHGDCIKVLSSTAGTGKDNPDNLEAMSQSQRKRTVAFPVQGSSFTATLGVAKRGSNPRKFLFAGHPSVACVLE